MRTEHYERGLVGRLIKGMFIGFNVLMGLWMVSYWFSLAALERPVSEAEKVGAAIGGTLGTGMILFVWALGAIVLGLLTVLSRGRKVVVEKSINVRPRG
jgi:hypothetical protein